MLGGGDHTGIRTSQVFFTEPGSVCLFSEMVNTAELDHLDCCTYCRQVTSYVSVSGETTLKDTNILVTLYYVYLGTEGWDFHH